MCCAPRIGRAAHSAHNAVGSARTIQVEFPPIEPALVQRYCYFSTPGAGSESKSLEPASGQLLAIALWCYANSEPTAYAAPALTIVSVVCVRNGCASPDPAQKRCLQCSAKFRVNPRLGHRHRYCANAECRKVAKRASQQRWLSRPENAGYFRGPANALRSKIWRAENPKRRRRRKTRPRRLTNKLAAALRACGAQDLDRKQLALVLGVASILVRSREQETIARQLRRIMVAGQAVLRSMGSSQDASADNA